MTDSQMIALFWERNEDAIRETDAVYGRRLYQLADQILRSAQDAEESVNDHHRPGRAGSSAQETSGRGRVMDARPKSYMKSFRMRNGFMEVCTMKKIAAAALALTMVASMAVPASAVTTGKWNWGAIYGSINDAIVKEQTESKHTVSYDFNGGYIIPLPSI